MKHLILLILTISLFQPCLSQNQVLPPDKVVANLYQQHAKQSPFFQTKNRAVLDTYFTKKLANLIWKDAHGPKDEVGALDGDPLYNAQDMEIKKFVIQPARVEGLKAKVPVTFENFGQKQKVLFSLVQESKGWKIENIGYADGYSLLKILQASR